MVVGELGIVRFIVYVLPVCFRAVISYVAREGDTASGGGKPATTETGLAVNVPFFVENGEYISVDTRTGEYLERAKN